MNKFAPYILYLLISILVVILYINDFGPMQNLQRSLDDFLTEVTSNDTSQSDELDYQVVYKEKDLFRISMHSINLILI